MSNGRVLVDYTTLVSAANVVNCARAFYPSTTENPYAGLLNGGATRRDSPMWLEVASLADLVEAVIIHEGLCVMDVERGDRNREVGRYTDPESQHRIIAPLLEESILEELIVDPELSIGFQKWLQDATKSGTLVNSLVDSLFELLKQPSYATLPDLFSHSQTVYKFDGETVWTRARELVDSKALSRAFRKKLRENAETIQLTATVHFYPEDILGFFIRGLYYNEVAKTQHIPYQPHGGRAPIVMTDGLWAAGATEDYARVPIQFVQKLRHDMATEVNSSFGCDLFDLDVPAVIAAVLREAHKPGDLLSVALQMRKAPAAQAYRSCMKAISTAESGLQLLKLKSELEELKQNLRKQLLLERQTISVGLWKFSFPVKLPGWMFTSFYPPGQRHMQFIRDLATATISVQNLESQLIRVFHRA